MCLWIKVLIILISLEQTNDFKMWLQFLVIFNQKKKMSFISFSVTGVGLVGKFFCLLFEIC